MLLSGPMPAGEPKLLGSYWAYVFPVAALGSACANVCQLRRLRELARGEGRGVGRVHYSRDLAYSRLRTHYVPLGAGRAGPGAVWKPTIGIGRPIGN